MIRELENLTVYADGGARGNPGPAAAGVIIVGAAGREIKKIGRALGRATNNQAEYQAVILGLEWLSNNIHSNCQINFYLDSELIVHQLIGNYRVKDATLKDLYSRVKEIMLQLNQPITFRHIPRTRNQAADKIVNQILDQEVEI